MTRKPTYEELERRIKELEEAVDRKANEASLQVSLEKYRVAFDTAKDAIFVTDETGRFVDVNRAACESLGYSKEELLQLSNMELDADERGYEAFLKLRNGLAETETFEVNQRKKDGTLLPVEITGSFFDCQRVRMSVAIARNITVRKQAEEMLQKAHDELERMVEERTADLAKSEARYRQMVENPLVGVWQTDIKGRFVFISKRLAEMSGYSQDEVIGMSMMVPIAPELRSWLAERMQKRKAGKLPPEVVEAEMVRKDGSRYTALVAPATLYDEEEKFNGFIGTMIDITERKRAEEKIKRLSSAVEQSIDGIAIGDLGPKLTFVNNAFSRMHGYSAEEMIGMKVVNLHNEEQVDEYKSGMNQIKTQGEWVGEIGHIRKDGTPFPTFMSVTLLKGADGKPTGILAAARDITERKQMEEALRKSEKMLSQILQGSSVPTFVIDNRHTITHWNKACENLTGVPASEVIGTKKQWSAFYSVERPIMADLIQEEQAEEEIARYYGGMYQKSALLGGACEAEGFFPNLGERGKWLFFTAAPLRDHQGKVIGAIETLQDVTERKQAEDKVKEAYRLREHFLKETSHRIITPVAIIGGNTDLLLKSSNLDDAQKEKIRIIRERNEEVQKLVRDALAGKYLEEEEGGEG